MELALYRDIKKLIVRDARPQEERKSRRKFQIADAISRARSAIARLTLEAEHESRVHQHSRQRLLDSVIEVPVFSGTLIEADQGVEVRRRRRLSIRSQRERGNDLPGADRLFAVRSRFAHED